MKKSKIFLPIGLILVLIFVFTGSIFLNKQVKNDIVQIERVSVNYSEARLFNYIIAPRGVKQTVLIKLQEDNSFVIISGGDNLSNDMKETIINDVKKIANKYINKIDGNLVEVVSQGYGGKITVTYDITDNNIKVVKILQSESYDHNSGYKPENGNPFNEFENAINSGNSFDDVTISGATITTNSLKDNYQVLQEYLAYRGGK